MKITMRCPDCGKLLEINVNVTDESATNIVLTRQVSENLTFKELAEQIKAGTSGLKVGDEISLKLNDGKDATIVVLDTIAFPGHIAFKFKDALFEAQMNEDSTNAGGYYNSKMFKTMEETFNTLLPSDLQTAITPRTLREVTNLNDHEISYPAYLWPLALTEISDCKCKADVDCVKFELFKDERSRICQNGGKTAWQWLRSAYLGNSTHFYDMAANGYVGGNSHANACYAVCPCFLI